ncbi:MAG: lamin tail domain-containing protein [Chloroflexi bacterium]|nr:lamin tail domain-containing protein [Chloroflexota bacterium]
MIPTSRWFLFAILLFLLASIWGHPLFAADSDIVISEVIYNSTCHGTTDDSICAGSSKTETHFEWVEIYNKGVASVNINGWQLCDNNGCDTLPDINIAAGEYWLVAYNGTALQTEFDQYTPAYTVISSYTIFLSSPLGGSYGLSNDSDYVYILNAAGTAVDCVSWASTAGTDCNDLTYVAGGDGIDTDLDGAQNGQSITNIQGAWYEHGPTDTVEQASPYASNSAAGGSPNAVILTRMSATVQSSRIFVVTAFTLSFVLIGFSAVRRHIFLSR